MVGYLSPFLIEVIPAYVILPFPIFLLFAFCNLFTLCIMYIFIFCCSYASLFTFHFLSIQSYVIVGLKIVTWLALELSSSWPQIYLWPPVCFWNFLTSALFYYWIVFCLFVSFKLVLNLRGRIEISASTKVGLHMSWLGTHDPSITKPRRCYLGRVHVGCKFNVRRVTTQSLSWAWFYFFNERPKIFFLNVTLSFKFDFL